MTYINQETTYGGFTTRPFDSTAALWDVPVRELFSLGEITFIINKGKAVLEDLTNQAMTGNNGRPFLTAQERAEVMDRARFQGLTIGTQIRAFERGSATGNHAFAVLTHIHNHYLCSKDQLERNYAKDAKSLIEGLKIK